MPDRDLKGELEVLVEEVRILNGENLLICHYNSLFGTENVNKTFRQLVDEGKIKDLYPLGTTKETAKPENTYYVYSGKIKRI